MGYGRPVDEAAPQNRTDEERVRFRPAVVDYDFIPTLDIPLLAGRRFSLDFPGDASRAYLLNKAAVERLGWAPEEAVGQSFKLGNAEAPEGEIIGVVDNFHITSLHHEIEPVVLQLHTLSPVGSVPFKLVARLAPDQIRDAVAHLEQQFRQIAPDASFRYVFLDDVFDQMYRSEKRLSRIITTFAGLAIFIACLGLFGLAAFTAEQRTKEIGIRKVLGATVSSIVALLSKDLLKLVAIGFVLAAPLAYFAMSRWLEDFAYHINIGPEIFILAGALTVVIALATVSYQAVKAAVTNPVESLRYE
jgi:putative ABC transport system permease protein